MTSRPVAPIDLPMPDFLRRAFTAETSRDTSIHQHGFTPSATILGWWQKNLNDNGLGHTFISPVQGEEGQEFLTRRSLFAAGDRAIADGSEDALLGFLWQVLLWGSGNTARNNLKRIEALRDDSTRQARVDLLRIAAGHARAGDRRSAYSSLIRSGGGVIPYLGPAFFTKFLYFVSGNQSFDDDVKNGPCLILDARVAQRLYEAGWSLSPKSRTGKAPTTFRYNWYTDTYVSYCELLDRWASEVTKSLSVHIHADQVEKVLFHPGGD